MRPLPVLALLLTTCPALLAAVAAPERPLTDPKAVVSLANPEAGAVSIEDLYYTRTVSSPAWSPDGKEVSFSTTFTGRMNLWKVAAAGGWPVQLSRDDDTESGSVWSPDGSRIVFQHDEAGDEVDNLYVIPSGGGTAVNLSSTKKASESEAAWSPDGAWIAFSQKPTTSSSSDVVILDWLHRTRRNLTRETDKNHEWGFVAWSADGTLIYANRAKLDFHDSDVYRIEVATGALTNLTPHQGDCLYAASALSPDGKTLLITSTQKGGHQNVATLNVGSRQLTWVTDLPWEAEGHDFSPDGSHLTYTVDEDGRTETYLFDRAAQKAERLEFPPGVTSPAGRPTAFSPGGDRLLLTHQDSRQPVDLWIYDLRTRQARQLTFSSLGSLSPARIPPSQRVQYRSFDGTVISAFLWLPFNLRRDGRNPGVVLAHGGPTGQTIDRFMGTVIALASRGYTVIAPNVRGSTGYGVEFEKSNYQDLGGGDLEDYVEGARFLAATGYVDAAKMGITGGSYGGYMAMMAIGKTPQVWAAAVELFGITDWLTEQAHEDPALQQYDQSKLGDPVKDRAVYEKASPIRYFKDAQAPLLVLQGANDVRDPKEEAEQAVESLKRAGKVVEAHYYANEGHGFTKRENQIDALRRTVEFFDRYLRGVAPDGHGEPRP